VEQSLETSAAPSGSQSVDRAASLLDVIVSSSEPRTFTSLVDELGLAKSTTSRLLHALERGRLVQRDRDGSFRAGALFAVYAARQSAVHDLAELTQPTLDRLAELTGETANFAVPRGDGVVQVAQADGRFLLGATNWVGVEVPSHCSAQGKVLYAFDRLALPPGPLERRTEATITTPEALAAELADIRRQGWASTWEELEVGLAAVAAPVRSAGGTVIGALSLSGPTARIAADRLPRLAALVAEHASLVSTQLGYSRKAGAA
jgi:DNA-binding IclR family transcriptional regulator